MESSITVLKILDKIYDVLIRIEKHLLKYEPKE